MPSAGRLIHTIGVTIQTNSEGHMKTPLVALVFAVASFNAAACDKFAIRVLPFDVYENTSLSVAELNDRFREPGKPAMVSFIRAQRTIKFDPQRCSLMVGYEDPTLYVANEANSDECMKKRVFAREHERLKVYERFVATLSKRVTATSRRIKDDFALGVKSELQSALFDDLTVVEHELEVTNSELSYSSLPFACDGAMVKFIPR